MEFSDNTKRIINYLRLTRIHKPIPILLLFLPVLITIFTQYFILEVDNFPFFKLISISFFGSIIVRSLGCVINDYFDQEIDKKTQRTMDRPLVSDDEKTKPTKFGVSILISILSSVALLLSSMLGKLPFIVSMISGFMVILYPLFKRFFLLPQLFLGITYNLGIIIISSYFDGGLNKSSVLFFFINILWTLCYDTVYAAQDLEDDKKNNVHSSVKTFGENWRIVVDKIYNIVFGLLIIFGILSKFVLPFYVFTIIGYGIAKYQFQKMKTLDKYQNFFEYNVVIFLSVLLGVIFEIIFKEYF